MKVVLFCGGLGTRLREGSDTIPKPLVEIGHRPIIWHLMKTYAHYGYKDFILCLGYRGDAIRDYFLNYSPYVTGDFVYEDGGNTLSHSNDDISDWRITFADTGLHSNLGQRLAAVKHYLEGEEVFLANYSDQLSDVPIDKAVDRLLQSDAIASLTTVRPPLSFHDITADDDGYVVKVRPVAKSDMWLNGGYFVFRPEIFDYIKPGEELVEEPFARLMEIRKLLAYRHVGFWQAMDTFKDKITFDRMFARGDRPWEPW